MFDALYNLAELVELTCFCFRNIVYIRLFAIIASFLYIFYSIHYAIYPMLYWSVLFIAINVYQLIVHALENRPVFLAEDLREIKHQFFRDMRIRDFLKIMKLSKKTVFNSDMLLKKGRLVGELMLLTKGTVKLKVHKGFIEMNPYHFIGELSFFNEQRCAADTIAVGEIEYYSWDFEDIRKMEEKQPQLFTGFVAAMGKDMAFKLLHVGGNSLFHKNVLSRSLQPE